MLKPTIHSQIRGRYMILDQTGIKGAMCGDGVSIRIIRSPIDFRILAMVCKHNVRMRKYLLTNNLNVIANI